MLLQCSIIYYIGSKILVNKAVNLNVFLTPYEFKLLKLFNSANTKMYKKNYKNLNARFIFILLILNKQMIINVYFILFSLQFKNTL